VTNGVPAVSWEFEAVLPRLSKMIREMYGEWYAKPVMIYKDPDKVRNIATDKEWKCKLRIVLIPMLEKKYIGVGIETTKFAESTTIFTAGIPIDQPPFTARLKEILETFEHGLRGDS
jgi:hypothetical protein